MAASLPVPVEFRLPQGWQAVDPDERTAPDVAFAAVHDRSDEGITPTITLDGDLWPLHETLLEIADTAVERLALGVESVRLRERVEVGTEDAPGLTSRWRC